MNLKFSSPFSFLFILFLLVSVCWISCLLRIDDLFNKTEEEEQQQNIAKSMEFRSGVPAKTILKVHKTTIISPPSSMNFCINISIHKLLKNEEKEEEEEAQNIVISPMSMNLFLNMLTIGTAGDTQIQLLDALHVKSVDELNAISSDLMKIMTANNNATGGPILSTANGVWTDLKFPLKPLYHQIATEFYKANTRSFDFLHKFEEVRLAVNSWAENETKGLIKDLIPPEGLNPGTKLVLANALYFKGAWKTPFQKSMTHWEDFYLLNGPTPTVKVPFLTNNNKDQYYRACDGFKLLRLPYESDIDHRKKFSMYIYLPDEKNGLETLLRKFNSDPSMSHIKCEVLVELYITMIPKFKITHEFRPSDTMLEMGIDLPFTSGCDLSNMVDSTKKGDLSVSAIVQKSVIEMNEEGTVAASVTYVTLMVGGKPWLDFIANHPFLFLIKEDTSGAVLFIGVVRNPMVS